MNIKNKKTILLFCIAFMIMAGPSIVQSFILIEKLGCKCTHVDTQTGAIRYQYYYCGLKIRERVVHTPFTKYLDKYHISYNKPDWKFVNSNGILLVQFCSLGKYSDLLSIFHEASLIIEIMEQKDAPSNEITAFINAALHEIQSGNYEQISKSWEQHINTQVQKN